MEKHAFERQTRTRKRPQAGSRVYGWWSLTIFTWNVEGYRAASSCIGVFRAASSCFELLRAARVPGVPRATKEQNN